MPVAAPKIKTESAQARSALRARLEHRREEIEAALLTRTHAIADPREAADPAYAEGLRRAVAGALDYGLETLERGDGREAPIPVELLAQARLAARSKIGLDVVLRRYFAGYSLFGFYLLEEAGREGRLSGVELQRLVATQAGTLDRLLATVGEEHARETESRIPTTAQRQGERVERLLRGEPVDLTGIAYPFEGWHVGILASGPAAEWTVRGLAATLDCRMLLLPRAEGILWAWLGARRPFDPADLLRTALLRLGGDRQLALGESGDGLTGWRLTHRQAAAALAVAKAGPEAEVRYADIAILASALQDDLLAASLRRIYLEPLAGERDGGAALRRSLRAYIDAQANASSAAASLGISRQAVAKRLQTAETRIGRPLQACLPDLGAALQLAELDGEGYNPQPLH